jgi:hypothetical protein
MLFFKDTKIFHVLEKVVLDIDKNIIGTPLQPFALLKIPPHDFNKVNYLYQEYIQSNPEILSVHILNQLNNDELVNIISSTNTDWSIDNQIIAKTILSQRNYQHTIIPSKGEIEKPMSIFLLFLIFAMGFVKILFTQVTSLAILISIFSMKTTMPNGDSFFQFDANSRSIAKFLFASLLIYLVYSYFQLLKFNFQ